MREKLVSVARNRYFAAGIFLLGTAAVGHESYLEATDPPNQWSMTASEQAEGLAGAIPAWLEVVALGGVRLAAVRRKESMPTAASIPAVQVIEPNSSRHLASVKNVQHAA